MKLLAYKCGNSVGELVKLCLKILAKGEKIAIRTGSREAADELSQNIWRAYNFLPHGVSGQEFDAIQPVIISDMNIKRDVFINFEGAHVRHDELESPANAFILWNCDPYEKSFVTYTQNEKGGWR